MELREAIKRADQILDEERSEPTVRYSARGWVSGPESGMTEAEYLDFLRFRHPRMVMEDPQEFEFSSTNYTLLCSLRTRLPQGDRDAFMNACLGRMHSSPPCTINRTPTPMVPDKLWELLDSELPLLAEFCVRNGVQKGFLRVLAEARPVPGHVVLLRHLEEMIAFNFTLFTEEEYQRLARSVSALEATAQRQAEDDPARAEGWEVGPVVRWCIHPYEMREELTAAVRDVKEECRKAAYLLLKNSLLEGINNEVNQDKQAVESHLQTLGFSSALRDSLNEAERLYREQGSAFSLKSSMGHLRSFLENLHAEKIPALHAKYGGELAIKWGAWLGYLRKNGVISQAQESLASSLYTFISDQAVHPLVAEREDARLARNMVIEYALLFLKEIEKLQL
jgi:hypothetical protein